MAAEPRSKPSFSPYRRWGIGLQVTVVIALVLSVVVMVNYLSQDFFLRFHWSTRTRNPLSPRTVRFVQTLTNQVRVTVYYDKKDPFFSTIMDLLGEYRLANSRISIATVDYLRDPGAAGQLKYPFLSSPLAKNLVIFDCEGKVKPVEGNELAQVILEQIPGEKDLQFRRKPVAFLGEQLFTAALLTVTSPKPLKAYFLQGHGEHAIDSGDKNVGYLKFATVFWEQNYIQVERLSLLGTNTVPMDCNLLVIAGPTLPLAETELEKVDRYLSQGGRLFALFNSLAPQRTTGLEAILAKWGVQVGNSAVRDPDNNVGGSQSDMVVSQFGRHAVVNPLLLASLHLINPRPISALRARTQAADAPHVEELAFSGPRSFLAGTSPSEAHAFPLMVAVEKGAIKDVITERGTTRMIITGDSYFLANYWIDSAANKDFLGYAVNWLLDRTQLLQGVGPQSLPEYRLIMTQAQERQTRWLLLGALPGAPLALGLLVWLRRRR